MARGAAGSIGVTPGQWERAAGRHWALTKANTFSTIEIPASLRRGPVAFGSEHQGSTPAARLSDNCEGSYAPRSFRRGKQAQFAHGQNTRPTGLWTTRCIRILLPQVGGAPKAFRGGGVPSRLVVLGNCGPPIGGDLSTVRVDSAPAFGVGGPVEAPPCIRQECISLSIPRLNATGASKLSATVSE